MIDVLTSATLKYLREYWWNDAFTEFLIDTLRPRPGNRILDVGCGTGMAEIRIGRLHLSQLRLFGVDLRFDRVAVARHDTAAHNQRVAFAAADAAAATPVPSESAESASGGVHCSMSERCAGPPRVWRWHCDSLRTAARRPAGSAPPPTTVRRGSRPCNADDVPHGASRRRLAGVANALTVCRTEHPPELTARVLACVWQTPHWPASAAC